MSIRLVSSARNLREQFKGNGGTNLTASSGASIFTSASGISNAKTMDPSNPSPSLLSRQGTLLRRSKSQQKRKLIAKVFTDDNNGHHDGTPDLSMEMTLVIVKRCIKEIRERGKSLCFVYPFSRYVDTHIHAFKQTHTHLARTFTLSHGHKHSIA